ncbi:MAG: EAL domain-containing protein [Magnetococcales bacterium]|nr:EAL domain-containing protein [Magnetococcales bacterium]
MAEPSFLHEAWQRLRVVLDLAPDAIVTFDEEGILLDANHAFDDLFGYPSGSMIGKPVTQVLDREKIRRVEGGGGKCSSGRHAPLLEWCPPFQEGVFEGEGIGRDGGRFAVWWTVGRYRLGEVGRLTAIFRDLTLHRQTLDALDEAYCELERRVLERTRALEEANRVLLREVAIRREAEEQQKLFAKVFEGAREGMLITDAQARIVAINPSHAERTGYPPEEVLGANPSMFRSGRHGADFYRRMWQSLRETGQWKGEIWDRNKGGEVFPRWLSIHSVSDEAGQASHYVGIFSDITHIEGTEERMQQLAYFDPLTQLPNRLLFRDRVIHEIAMSRRTHSQAALFFIDLDRFKYVNDTMGHDAGDQLLMEVAGRLQRRLRQSDTIARMGGDEFTVLLPNPGKSVDIGHLAQKVILDLQQPFVVGGKEFFIGASIGITLFPDDGDDYETLSKNADMAMYHAKEAGRGVYRFFSPRMNERTTLRLSLEMDLRKAMEQDELILFYQPKIQVSTGRISGMEALIRWRHPQKGMVSPGDFIPLAEETGLIVPMGLWVLRTACRQVRIWRDMGWKHLRVAVNLSPRQVQGEEIVREVAGILEETALSSDGLELEITESIAMSDVSRSIGIIREFRHMGLHISIDDFGTGYSSLSYLKSLPLHALKIDQSFVRDLVENSDDASIVTSIISMARAMNLEVVAEGVETAAQLAFLARQNCAQAQGYFFSRPVPADEFLELLKKQGYE